MKQLNDVEREYEGSSDSHMQNQQLEIAIRALHVIAVMGDEKTANITNLAIDALREMETYGYLYEHLSLDYD
jgi:hypothetical protein|tara:strand:+ start:125 stop:340 length:216 start_codon:yes stop_codon:yes gene_type:complete